MFPDAAKTVSATTGVKPMVTAALTRSFGLIDIFAKGRKALVDNGHCLRLHLVEGVKVKEIEIIGHLSLFYQFVADRPLCLPFHEDEQVLGQLEPETGA